MISASAFETLTLIGAMQVSAMNSQQHRPLPSNNLQHGFQRQGSLRACRTSQTFTRAATKRHTTCSLDWRTVANDFKEQVQKQKNAAVLGGVGALTAALAVAGPSIAADMVKTGTCLLGNCQLQLAECVADPQCFENLACLQLCNGRKDEAGCQIRCGDLYNDKAIQTFTACAVSDKKCVPQKIDRDAFPEPKAENLDKDFDLNKFEGRWYITAGLNPLFDDFDCQEHYFGVPEPGKLYGKINWRIQKPDKDFIERSTVQTFKQQANPAVLYNGGNDYLHYEDTWYILASKPNEYVVIYYIGNNDAWKGYGGGTVYTRSASLPDEYVPEIKQALGKIGQNWDDWKITDNTCKPHPPVTGLIQRAEKFAEYEFDSLEKVLENDLTSFGKGLTVLETNLANAITGEEKIVEDEIAEAEKYLLGIEKQYGSSLPSWLNWGPFKFFFSGTQGSGNYGAAK